MIDPTIVRAPTQAGALKKKSVNEVSPVRAEADHEKPYDRPRPRKSARVQSDRGEVHNVPYAETLKVRAQPEAALATRATTPTSTSRTSGHARSTRSPLEKRIAKSNEIAISPFTGSAILRFIKQFGGIARRYEKTARNFLAGLQLVCALAWVK
jgi:transposase